jgi:type VI secretion system protein ImpB
VVKQVEPLRQLFEARQRLVDLLAKLDGNDRLDALLQEIVENPESQQALKTQTAAAPAA